MTAPAPPRHPRHALVAVWAVIGVAVVAVVALLATGRLNANVLPKQADRPPLQSVRCFDADGDPLSGWSATARQAARHARVDPLAICAALYKDHSATAQMDRMSAEQQALGRDCVTFDTSDGEHWTLSGLVVSPQGTYFASGGPAPGRLPGFGTVAQPAPLVSPPPAPTPGTPCTTLPTVSWDLTVPPMVACTSDDVTVSVFVRTEARTARAVCAAEHLVVAD